MIDPPGRRRVYEEDTSMVDLHPNQVAPLPAETPRAQDPAPARGASLEPEQETLRMRTRSRLVVKCLALAAAVALLPTLVPSTGRSGGPYVSALDGLGAATAVAATVCNNKACTQAPRGLKFTCATSAGTNCKAVNGGRDCAVSTC